MARAGVRRAAFALLVATSVAAMGGRSLMAEPAVQDPAADPARVEALIAALEEQLTTVDALIVQQDARLDRLYERLDLSDSPEEQASLITLVDRQTQTLDRLEEVRGKIAAKLDELRAAIDRAASGG